MTDVGSGSGRVVVNRAMSLDGFIAGPGDAMDWIGELVPPDVVAEVAKATGAMLVGRRTWDVGERMKAEAPGNGDYPFNGPMFLLTHRPWIRHPGRDHSRRRCRGGGRRGLAAAGGKDLELLGADVAAQALARGLVDEILVYLLPVVLGGGVPFSPAGSGAVDLELLSSRRAGAATVLRFRVRK